MLKITKIWSSVLRNGLSFNLHKLQIGTMQGNIDAYGSIQIPKLNEKASIAQLPLLASANFRFQVPKQWLIDRVTRVFTKVKNNNQTPPLTPHDRAMAMIKKWEDKNFMVSERNYYISTINYKNGKLLINGKVPDFRKKSPVTDTQPIPQKKKEVAPNKQRWQLLDAGQKTQKDTRQEGAVE